MECFTYHVYVYCLYAGRGTAADVSPQGTKLTSSRPSSSLLSLLLSDLQHSVVGALPLGEGFQGSAAAAQRGELNVSRQTHADHGRPEQDALPEGRHQGDAAVSPCGLVGFLTFRLGSG